MEYLHAQVSEYIAYGQDSSGLPTTASWVIFTDFTDDEAGPQIKPSKFQYPKWTAVCLKHHFHYANYQVTTTWKQQKFLY